MNSKYLLIVTLAIFMIAVSGCTSPAPTASPTAATSATPTDLAAASATPDASPAATAAPSPTPAHVYSSAAPVSVSNIKIDWDTTQFTGQAHESATMTVKNMKNDSVVLDVMVYYVVSTPAMYAGPGGQSGNYTSNITKSANIGMMEPGEQKDISFQVDHTKNVPATISVTVQWRGGSSVVFSKTMDWPDNKFGTSQF